MESDKVAMTVKEWAEQEKALIDQFALEIFKEFGAVFKFHPGRLDDMFRLWHEDCGEKAPEET